MTVEPAVVVVVVEASALEVYTRVTLATATVGGKALERWRRTSKRHRKAVFVHHTLISLALE